MFLPKENHHDGLGDDVIAAMQERGWTYLPTYQSVADTVTIPASMRVYVFQDSHGTVRTWTWKQLRIELMHPEERAKVRLGRVPGETVLTMPPITRDDSLDHSQN